MRIFYVLLLALSFVHCFAGELKYKVADIPAELRQNARIVIRDKECKFILSSISNAVLEIREVITVLNDNGIEDSKIAIEYGKYSKVSNFKQTIYNEFGEKVNIPDVNEVMDISAISGFSLYEDNRAKYFDPQQKATPFTVEYSYKINYDGLFIYPTWQLYKDYNISTERSRFEVVVPEGMEFRYFLKNLDLEPQIKVENKQRSYIWDTSMLKAIVEEPFSLPISEYTPAVYTAPKDFKISGYRGNLETWQGFGKWIELLNEGRDSISTETKKELLALVSQKEGTTEKIKAIYEYMQDRTRYVSIQVGIGGWQPFEAETIDRLGYGDCKALSNYTKALLKAVGIKAYYTLVTAGKDAPDIIVEFPSSQFNHAIIFIPMDKDTIWLECTDQDIPFGYIGTFTDDRNVLVIDGDSTSVIHTRVYNRSENIKINNAEVNIFSDGNGKATITTIYSGVFYDDIQSILRVDNEKRKDKIYNNLQIPDFNITDFRYEEIKQEIPLVNENLQIDIINYCKTIGDKLLLDLNLMNKIEALPIKIENRLSDILIRRSKVYVDSIAYHFPSNYSVKTLPAEINESSEFGSYNSKVERCDDGIIYIRRLEIYRGIYPKERYDSFVSFYQKCQQYDKAKLVLLKI